MYLEALTCPKDPARPETNEDQMVLRPGVVLAVIDGATDISGERFDDTSDANATGGRLVSRAMAEALTNWDGGGAEFPPQPEIVLDEMNKAIVSLYRRIGRFDAARANGDARFRATFAGAFFWRDVIRLVCVGDSGFRVNGAPVLEKHFPGDAVLSAARSAGWRLLIARGFEETKVRSAARQFIVKGLANTENLEQLGFSQSDVLSIETDVLSRSDVLAAVSGDTSQIRHILAGGLEAIRKDPAAYDALAMDGFSDFRSGLTTADFARDEVSTLEIFSDGYPTQPDGVSIAAWEAALNHVDRTDPDRINGWPGTKGCDQGKFGDDRTIIISKSTLPANS